MDAGGNDPAAVPELRVVWLTPVHHYGERVSDVWQPATGRRPCREKNVPRIKWIVDSAAEKPQPTCCEATHPSKNWKYCRFRGYLKT